MFIFLVFLIVIVAVLLTLVVLLQSGKGGGLAGIASGGQTTQILGARQAPDFLEKATWGLGTLLLALCFVAPFLVVGDGAGSLLQERADELPAAPAPATAPGGVAPADGDAVPLEGDASGAVEAPQTNPVSPAEPSEAAGDAPE